MGFYSAFKNRYFIYTALCKVNNSR